MKKKHKKKLIKFLLTLIVVLIVTGIGYFENTFYQETNNQILEKQRNRRNAKSTEIII